VVTRALHDGERRLGALQRREEALLPRSFARTLVELGRDDDGSALAHHRRRREAQIGRGP
jgi:hypothetical protein